MKPRSATKLYGTGESCKRIYLIAPRHPTSFWSLSGTVDLLGAKTLMPNTALATLMALTPPDVSVEYRLGDENVGDLDFAAPCDLVAITGGTLHAARIAQLCAEFRKRGVPVALGGTYASLNADRCEGLADHLFVGEAEHTWPLFLRQWSANTAQPLYVQEGYIDMGDSPAPDWSLIDVADYLNLPLQTSRGCPHCCDFCDVIQYVGRKYRTKPIDKIMAELRAAHALGSRNVFFSDDNFLGDKAFTEQLLDQVVEWNSSQREPLSFATQITVAVADDEALLRKFADARFTVLFLGVETVRRASLAEVHKAHNLKHDLVERVRRVSRHGMMPFLGLIVGFDHDDASVFDQLFDFLDETSSPIAGISLLNAPRNTPLYKRLTAENRLVGEDFSGEWQLSTNIIPKLMTADELRARYWRLFQRIYEPSSFDRRLRGWLGQVSYFTTKYANKKNDLRSLRSLGKLLRYLVFGANAEVRRLFLGTLLRTLRRDPRMLKRTITLLVHYRHFYDFVNQPLPALTA